MKHLTVGLLLASTFAATPALALDHAWYAGIEGGIMKAKKIDVVGAALPASVITPTVTDLRIRKHSGVDADIIAGYDFGMFRLEAELGYKHASRNRVNYTVQNPLLPLATVPTFTDFSESGRGSSRVYSAMANALIDLNVGRSAAIYAGGGVGYAKTKLIVDTSIPNFTLVDSGIAYQGIAGLRFAVSQNVDVGLKYRYFVGNKMNDSDLGRDFRASRFKSHSLLASLIFNYAAPPPPPPPPPPPEPTGERG